MAGGSRSSAHRGSALRKVTPGQPGLASDKTPRVRVRRMRPWPQVHAQGLRRHLSCHPLWHTIPNGGRQLVTDSARSAGSLCGLPILAPATQPDASRCSLGAGDLAASLTEELEAAVSRSRCRMRPSSCTCPYSRR